METRFTVLGWRMSAGMWIWAAHFAGAYIWTALACARGWHVSVQLGIAVLTLPALAALLWVLWQCLYGRWRMAQRAGERHAEEYLFIPRIAAMSAALGLIAVLWSAMPAIWTPACSL